MHFWSFSRENVHYSQWASTYLSFADLEKHIYLHSTIKKESVKHSFIFFFYNDIDSTG